jgi:hypothetical protein
VNQTTDVRSVLDRIAKVILVKSQNVRPKGRDHSSSEIQFQRASADPGRLHRVSPFENTEFAKTLDCNFLSELFEGESQAGLRTSRAGTRGIHAE